MNERMVSGFRECLNPTTMKVRLRHSTKSLDCSVSPIRTSVHSIDSVPKKKITIWGNEVSLRPKELTPYGLQRQVQSLMLVPITSISTIYRSMYRQDHGQRLVLNVLNASIRAYGPRLRNRYSEPSPGRRSSMESDG